MPKSRPPYALEFRRQMVELVRAGRDPEDLSREFRTDSPVLPGRGRKPIDRRVPVRRSPMRSVAERDELARRRHENRQSRVGHPRAERVLDALEMNADCCPAAASPPRPGGRFSHIKAWYNPLRLHWPWLPLTHDVRRKAPQSSSTLRTYPGAPDLSTDPVEAQGHRVNATFRHVHARGAGGNCSPCLRICCVPLGVPSAFSNS
jgi:transposase